MKSVRRSLAITVLAGAAAAAWFGGSALFHDNQFARAAEQVELSRQQLQNVQDLSTVYRQVAKVVEPSVVMIEVKKTVAGGTGRVRVMPDLPEQFKKLLPMPPDNGADEDDSPEVEMGEGSGVIMETDGSTAYVMTNNHVAGGASEMHVTLADGRIIDNAKLVGADPKSDVAIVKFTADHVIAAKWGDSDSLEKGDLILAFGSPFGYVGSMTHGIVSALNRDHVGIIGSQMAYENFIQVDAPINPGNSGGPLVNLKGEVVGINTAIASRTGAFNGIGFAIPANMAKPVYEQLKGKGKVTRGWLGVEIANVGEPRTREAAKAAGFTGDSGVFVAGVRNGTPAAGKLQAGDVITAINGKEVTNATQLRNIIAVTPPGTDVKFTLSRDGKSIDVTIKVAEQPENLLAANMRRGQRSNGTASDETTADALGVNLVTPTDDQVEKYGLADGKGALITGVQPNGMGAKLGLKVGDLITRVGDKPVKSAADATEALSKKSDSTSLRITSREGERFIFVKPPSKSE